MKKSFFPNGLLYKEWMQKRWVALVAFIIISPSIYLESLMALNGPAGPGGAAQQFQTEVNTFTWYVNTIVGHMSGGWWATFVVVGLATYSLWTERNHDVGWFTFLGPVTKRQVLRSKYVFDLALIFTVFTILAISLAIIDAAVGIHYPMYGIFRWWVAELAIQCSMYSLALFVGTLIGNIVAVALITLGIAYVPMYLGIPLTYALGSNPVVFYQPSHTLIPLSWKAQWVFTHLSPLNWMNTDLSGNFGAPPLNPWTYFICFLLFTVLICLVSERIYAQIATERLSNFFAFKWLVHPVTFVLSGIVAFIVVKFTVRTTLAGSMHYMVDVYWILGLTLLLWLVASVTRRQLAKRF